MAYSWSSPLSAPNSAAWFKELRMLLPQRASERKLLCNVAYQPPSAPRMTRLPRRLASLLCSFLLLIGLWVAQPPRAQADGLRNLADEKIGETQGKVDLNNASVRRFQQFPGMYPTLAGKIVVGGPYDSVDDVLKLDLTGRQKELFAKYRDNFTVTDPEIALNEGFDRINDGQYR